MKRHKGNIKKYKKTYSKKCRYKKHQVRHAAYRYNV